MKFFVHVFASLIFSLAALFFAQPVFVFFIFLAHFVPSVDYVMKQFRDTKKYHRKLFHNLFVWAGFSFAYLLFLPLKVVLLMGVNHLLHLVMDLDSKGVELFYPVSRKKYKLF